MAKLIFTMFAVCIILVVVMALASIGSDWFRSKLGLQKQSSPPPRLQRIAPTLTLMNIYIKIGECLRRAINNNEDCCLHYMRNSINSHIALKERFCSNSKYSVIMYFEYTRIPEEGVNMHTIDSKRYNTFPVEEMAKIINRSFPNFCIAYGYVPFVVISAENVGDGRVRFGVAEAPDNIWEAS